MNPKTLVCGDGPAALVVAKRLLALDRQVVVAVNGSVEIEDEAAKDSGFELLANARVVSCAGAAGDFRVRLKQDPQIHCRQVENIIIATEAVRQPDFSGYGLNPSQAVTSLSRLVTELEEPPKARPSFGAADRVVFLTGLKRPGLAVVTAEVLGAAQVLAERYGADCRVFTQHVQVNQNWLEASYQACKTAGVVFVKPDPQRFEILQGDGGFEITFFDETVRMVLRLTATRVIVDEIITPSPYLQALMDVLALEGDAQGWAQSDNVRRLTVATNRPGIFVAGAARAVTLNAGQALENDNAVLSALKTGRPDDTGADPRPRIDEDLCIHCLTCFRLCPHKAVLLQNRTVTISVACQACGLCVSACPRRAIRQEVTSVAAPLLTRARTEPTKVVPFTVFMCRRSALPAGQMAAAMGHIWPEAAKLIPVNCACALSHARLLDEIESGAAGVLMLTCHEGNCHATRGPLHARLLSARSEARLTQMGITAQRIAVGSLAANMGHEFAQYLNNFTQTLAALGPIGPEDSRGQGFK